MATGAVAAQDLRDRGQIDDEVLLRVPRELDLEESILMRD